MTAHEHPTIVIEVTLKLELGPDEVWPDTGVPEGWTVEDVVARVQESGTFRRFLEDWEADLFGAEVGVDAKGRYARGSLR